MNAFKLNLAALGMIGLLTGCVGVPTNGTGVCGVGSATNDVAKLQGGEWVVQSINGKAVDTQLKPTLNFGQTFQLTGHTSCNTYFAGYLLTGPSIVVKQAGTTRMACEPAVMEQEQRFLEALGQVQRWDVSGIGQLRLWPAEGKPIRLWPEEG